jgi:hypothetical protein
MAEIWQTAVEGDAEGEGGAVAVEETDPLAIAEVKGVALAEAV